jgi:hypothetical protein
MDARFAYAGTEPTVEQKSLQHQLGLELPERFQLNRKCSVDPAVA